MKKISTLIWDVIFKACTLFTVLILFFYTLGVLLSKEALLLSLDKVYYLLGFSFLCYIVRALVDRFFKTYLLRYLIPFFIDGFLNYLVFILATNNNGKFVFTIVVMSVFILVYSVLFFLTEKKHNKETPDYYQPQFN